MDVVVTVVSFAISYPFAVLAAIAAPLSHYENMLYEYQKQH